MKRFTTVATAVFVVAGTALTFTEQGGRRFREFLNGFNEATTVVSTTGTGTFRATINRDEDEIDYELTFRNLEGDVRQAHIHIGHPQNQGGVVLWLCDSDTNQSPSATTPECTDDDAFNTRAGKVSGKLTAADVQAQATNGIAGPTPEEFAEVIALIRAGRTYVNLHSSKFTPGEIRSQIADPGGDRGEHHHN